MKPKFLTRSIASSAALLFILSMETTYGQAQWNSAEVSNADFNTTGSASFTWSDETAWTGGNIPTSVAGQTVSLEPRQSGAATITVDGTYTLGSLTSRAANNNVLFTGNGKLIFDNGANPSIWNAHSRITRFTNLRTDLNIDIQLNSNLDIRFGVARAEEAAVGRIGKTISGAGALTLSLGQNDASTSRLIKLGNAGANTYTGGTEIRHISQTGSYGNSNGILITSLMVNALSTGTFGTGDVVLNSQGLNQTAQTSLTTGSGGLQVVFSADNVTASTAKLTQSGDGAGLILMGSTQQEITGLVASGTGSGRKRINSTSAALKINTAADQNYAYNGIISGGTSIEIAGSGTQNFTNANTYTGATTVTGGTLSIGSGGSLGDTAVTVEANGTLAGIGSIAGFTTIEGFHAPGLSPGIQTFSGGLTYAPSSTLTWELFDNVTGVRGTDFDGVDVTGGVFSLESGATIDLSFGSSVDFLDGFWGTDRSWLVVDLGPGVTGNGGTGVFSIGTISGGSNFSPALGNFAVSRLADDDDKNDVYLTWTAIPEPSSLLLAVLGLFPFLARRRRG